MTDVARMIEMIGVGDHIGAKPRENVVDVAAFGGKRLVEARRETRRRVRRGDAAVAIARAREILGGERDERPSDGGVGVGLETGENGWSFHGRSKLLQPVDVRRATRHQPAEDRRFLEFW